MTNPSEQGGAETYTRPGNEAVMLGTDLRPWQERIESLMARGAKIVAFRGAGTVNGIDPWAANEAAEMLEHFLSHTLKKGGTPLALLYDGDQDDREKPDIGAIFGMMADCFKDNPNVVLLAAQTKSWYYPPVENGHLANANGIPYETYVFDDGLEGAHAALTQSPELVAYKHYEQVLVGPVGPIALSQLQDLSRKAVSRPAENGPVQVTVIKTPNNQAVGVELAAQFEGSDDTEKKLKIGAKLAQRTLYPYGACFDPNGRWNVDGAVYPGVALAVTATGA